MTEDFSFYEELLAMETLPGRTWGIDIYSDFRGKCAISRYNLNNIVSVCTDRAPLMKGKTKRFVALLKKEI